MPFKKTTQNFSCPAFISFFNFTVMDTSNSVKAYWKYLQHDTKYITIGYVRKSPTDETKESRIRLLQLMVNKLYSRGKCEEVFMNPICKADQPILERGSPKLDDSLLHLEGPHGDISGTSSLSIIVIITEGFL